MTKKDYTNYIEKVYTKFIDARNHGGGGNNWWYPTQNTIAYNVKMHRFATVETLRTYLTKLQNEYYTDETLQDVIYQEQEDTCRFLVEDIKEQSQLITGVNFAGRSGGWVEVTYTNNIDIDITEIRYNYTVKDIKEVYAVAKELEETEAKVSKFIEDSHTYYNKYIDTKEYYTNLVDLLVTDEDIRKEYKARSEHYQLLATQ